MRTALTIPVGLALALASPRASAEMPHVALRLEYGRGSGGQACPAEPTSLRAEVAALMGYDPFETESAPDRLTILLTAKGREFAAHVERFNEAGAITWSDTFSMGASRGGCAALMSPLASYLRGMILPYQRGPAAPPPVAPPLEPEQRQEDGGALPAPTVPVPIPPAAPPPKPRTLSAHPANLPAPANVPTPSHMARNVAIVAYGVGGAFLGLGIRWAIYGQSQANAAQALATQSHPTAGDGACRSGSVPSAYCGSLLSAWQNSDNALSIRNGWFAAAGISVAVGAVATVWALDLPAMNRGQQKMQVTFRPGGLVFSGSF